MTDNFISFVLGLGIAIVATLALTVMAPAQEPLRLPSAQPYLFESLPTLPPPQPKPKAPRIGHGLACDTVKQVARFIELKRSQPFESGPNIAAIVNAEAEDQSACAFVAVAFFPGEQIKRIERDDATYAIVSLVIVGAATANGVHPIPEPLMQFTVLRIPEVAA